MNFKAIYKGWKVFISDKSEKPLNSLQKRRLTICSSCPFAYKVMAGSIEEDILEVEHRNITSLRYICKECGCPLFVKIRQNIEICDKWKQ